MRGQAEHQGDSALDEPPTPRDLVRVISLMRQGQIGTLIHTVYHDNKSSQFVAEKANANVITLATSVHGAEGVDDYFELFDYNLDLLLASFQSSARGTTEK